MKLEDQIKNYIPFNEQEEIDKKYFLNFINTYEDVLTRNNLIGHFSASAFVVDKKRTKMLCVYHIINDGWMYPGGHADGEENLLAVAMREVEEETGLKPKLLDENIFSIQAAPTRGHIKNGKYVPAHIHFDVVYIMEADEKENLSYRKDESKGVKWIDFKNVANKEIVSFMRPINKKLVEKLKKSHEKFKKAF